jgi:hypothetical protein
MTSKVSAAALLMSLMTIDQALAGYWKIVPNPPPIPEFDGSSSIAVIALLAGVAAIIWSRARNH